MRAFDTDVIVRLMVRDDPKQLSTAELLLDEPFLVLPTVLMETVWVLVSNYQVSRAEVVARLLLFLRHGNAVVVSAEAIKWALQRYAAGAGFADVLHLALAAEAEASAFATFDRKVARQAADRVDLVELL